MKKNKIIVMALGVCACISAVTITASAAMFFNVYGALTSGNWNPFKTDVASTYGYVGWVNQNIRDNYGHVDATIYWKDSSGNDRTTKNSVEFTDVAGKTPTVNAESGNDDSHATSYHYGYLYDRLSNKSFSDSGHKSE